MTDFSNLSLDEFKAKFSVVHEQVVAWGDMDAFGHLNNVLYYRYIESARIKFINELGWFSQDFMSVIAKSSCHYMRSVEFPDTLYVGVSVSQMGTSSICMDYVLYSQQQSQVVAQADSVMVLMAKDLSAKTAIPDAMKRYILEHEAKVGNKVVLK